ncbi:DUF1573 domain-containing protein [Tautonia plasticadhaerens]|uniref:DUF1573 domain-containing protein n=1 Tax=Tautonia plasticadhaerens TaxID=2527974 RepID=A0A518GY08_9BACT|nr:DUF1573 domain-containing protein [Tautonia plasticadhaerens]QDV33481.1 hypothetical protein ElP_13540 [Tautonia plasticadhaerens]
MVRWIILAVLVVAVSATVPLAVSYLPADVSGPVPASRTEESEGPPPEVVVEGEPTFNFGIMSEQDEGVETWVVRNQGEGPLRLRFVEKPCTCTGVKIGEDRASMVEGEEFVVDPGDQVEIALTWETRQKIGEFSTFARFATNDYERNPTFTLTIEGTVTPSVVVNPPRLDFPATPSDEEISLSTMVFSPTMPELAITGEPKTSRPGSLVPEIRPLTDEELQKFNEERTSQSFGPSHAHVEGEPAHDHETIPQLSAGYLLTVTLKPGMPLGRFADAVGLKTDHPLKPALEIPVSGQIVGPISAMPERVYMPGITSSRGRSTNVTLNVRNHDQTAFTVRIPESLREVLETSIDPEPTASERDLYRQYRMEVRVPKGAKPGQYRGTIVLQTDHPQAEEIKIPVDVLIRGG